MTHILQNNLLGRFGWKHTTEPPNTQKQNNYENLFWHYYLEMAIKIQCLLVLSNMTIKFVINSIYSIFQNKNKVQKSVVYMRLETKKKALK